MKKVGLVLIGCGILHAALASADCTVQVFDGQGQPFVGVAPIVASGDNAVLSGPHPFGYCN